MHKPLISPSAAWLAFAAGLVFATGAAAEGARIGLLDCKPAPASGLLFGAGTTIECRLLAPGDTEQVYYGLVETGGTGIPAATAVLAWAVEAPDATVPASLDGAYKATAAVGAGPAAKVSRLVGGPGGAISLIPASIMSQSGVNLAGSVTGLKLKAK